MTLEAFQCDKRIGGGFHTDVYPFSPPTDLDKSEWVIKAPTNNTRIWGDGKFGYNYGQDVKKSLDLLEVANTNGIYVPYAEMYLYGKPNLPIIVQRRINGIHPHLFDHDFFDVLNSICAQNRELYREYKATFDCYHFCTHLLAHGLSKNAPLDGFILDAEDDNRPTLIDCQLLIYDPSDTPQMRIIKQGLLGFQRHIFQSAFDLDFI